MRSNIKPPGLPLSQAMRLRPLGLTMVAPLVVLVTVWVGCGEPGPSSQDLRLADDLARQLNSERLHNQRDSARHDAELAGAEADYRSAVLGWAGTAAATFLLIILLAKERRARRVVERLLRLVLDRLRNRQRNRPRESRGPPSP